MEPAAPASADADREEAAAEERRAALLRSLTQRRFPELEGEKLEKLREARHFEPES
jgi:hypothetical protein